ncbi:MAG: insulinase family protein [Desulfocapsaceae bacterium]|nr:insulinase family protein [Desulfocapsaceae bacterium]
MKNRQSLLAIIVFFLAFLPHTLCSQPLPSGRDTCPAETWPHETSVLKPDPRLVFGRLANGFRYVLMKNAEPRDRVAMYLDVRTGSLNETDEQRGLAHFLEHMVFNGSTHFEPGQLVGYFQSLGMSFGGDTNAHTGYNETVYDILLPKGDVQEIDKGLLVFSDYARGALLLDSEINRERGVIFSEKRARDSAAYRQMVATLSFAFRGTRLPERFPIGVQKTLEQADHSRLQAYYDAWYRPENMILVMVGEFDPQAVKGLISKHFSQLSAKGPRLDCPDFGHIRHSGLETLYHFEPELGAARVEIGTVWDERPKNDSLAFQVQELKKNLLVAMISHRLEKLEEDPDTPFTDSSYSENTVFGHAGQASLSVSADSKRWQAALRLVERTLRQALQYGFSAAEFERVKKEALADCDRSVQTVSTRSSMDLADQIIRDLNANRVSQSPLQKKDLLTAAIQKMQLQEVQEAFTAVWAHPSRLVMVTGNAKISSEDPDALIREVYAQTQQEAVAPPLIEEKVQFPYLQLPNTPAEPVSVTPLAAIGAERLVFANGLVLNLKKTDFDRDTVSVRVDFGNGSRDEPAPGMGLLAQAVVNGSGSGRLTATDLGRVLTGSSVDLSFHVNESSFSWEGNSAPKDMELLFQILQVELLDPGIRDEAYQVAMENFKQMYKRLSGDIKGGLALHVKTFLAGGYPHAGMPLWQDFEKLRMAQLREWLLPAIADSPLEISVVGDFDRQQIVALAGRYFGGLAVRSGLPAADGVPVTFPQGKRLLTTVDSSIDKAMVVVAWPTEDFWDISRTRRLGLLASVLDDRLRKKVREELGASYSPVVFNASSRIFPGYGLMQAQIIVEPGAVDRISEVVLALGEELQKNGCTDEELERAKAPIMTSLKDMLRTNRYWLNTVLSLSARYPQQLVWPQSIVSDYESITSKDINSLANIYLPRARAAVALVTPVKDQKNRQSALPDNP